MKHSANFCHYLQLSQQLFELRASNGDLDCPEEDALTEDMNDAWWELTDEERDKLKKSKRVLVTSGPVSGRLDDNKLVGNRVRGIWTTHFAEYLSRMGYWVTLLVADTHAKQVEQNLHSDTMITVIPHTGYHDYAAKCYVAAKYHSAAVMAAAVVNWIPANPIKGKMATEGFKEGDIINIPFVLAPRVINRMREINPKLTLIGCKMLINAEPEALINAAYHVLLTAKCNVVLANDMGRGLKTKLLVYPDRTVVTYKNSFHDLYEDIRVVIDDEHYNTVFESNQPQTPGLGDAKEVFDNIVNTFRDRFIKPVAGKDMVFGSVAVAVEGTRKWLVSPREKGEMFTSEDATEVLGWRRGGGPNEVVVRGPNKATHNAILLILFGEKHNAKVVVHLHEQIPGAPTLPYAPPGTVRDNHRELPDGEPVVNIEGHGCLMVVQYFA